MEGSLPASREERPGNAGRNAVMSGTPVAIVTGSSHGCSELTAGFTADDWAAMEWLMSGTHERDLPGMPAAGKTFSVRGATILELRDGRITRNRDYWDLATFLKQIGLMPSTDDRA
jgi:ketosteroid isomerase-like protein